MYHGTRAQIERMFENDTVFQVKDFELIYLIFQIMDKFMYNNTKIQLIALKKTSDYEKTGVQD